MTVKEKLEAGLYDSLLPEENRPNRPHLNARPTSEQALAYAAELKEYEVAAEAWRQAHYERAEDQRRLYELFKRDLIDDAFGQDAQEWPTLVENLFAGLEEFSESRSYLLGRIYDLADVVAAAKQDRDAYIKRTQ